MARIQALFANGARMYRQQADDNRPYVCAYRVYEADGTVIAERFSKRFEAAQNHCKDIVAAGTNRTYEIVKAVPHD